MRLNKVKSKNAISYYIIRSVRRGGKNSSEIVKKLGTEKSIRETYGVDDVDAWAREQLQLMNEKEAASDHRVLVPFTTNITIGMNAPLSFNSGYLFLQQIYYQLGLPSICRAIKKDNSFEYDLNSILSRLLYGRILYPSQSCHAMSSHRSFLSSQTLNCIRFTVPFLCYLKTLISYSQSFISAPENL